MSKLYMMVCVSVFTIGALVFQRGAATQKVDTEAGAPVPFEVTYLVITTGVDGKSRKSVRTRQVQANGEWRELLHGTEKRVTIANLREGAFSHVPGEQEREKLTGRFPDEDMLRRFRTPSFLRSHPAFVGMDKVAGLEVYVHRESFPEKGIVIEKSYSPRTGFTPLKIVSKEHDGSSWVCEAVKVEFKEVPPHDDLRALPVRQK